MLVDIALLWILYELGAPAFIKGIVLIPFFIKQINLLIKIFE